MAPRARPSWKARSNSGARRGRAWTTAGLRAAMPTPALALPASGSGGLRTTPEKPSAFIRL
eukprot:1640414-Alexandrium_andersonii.AAC.1